MHRTTSIILKQYCNRKQTSIDKIFLVILIIFLSSSAFAQKIETVYLNAQDSSTNNYIIIYPPTLPYTGFMFLVQGMYKNPSDIINQTSLPLDAARKGILTIIPTFKTGISSFGIDTATQNSFLEILNHVVVNNKLEDKIFYLGGFSIGGTCALKYAELAISNNYPIKPTKVFALDSPLDFERMYNAMLRETQLANPEKFDQEEQLYFLDRFEKEFGGTPTTALNNYYALSPYSFNDSSQQAIKSLVNLPIRLYTEPDILWWLSIGADYSGMNAFDFAALTNELTRMGNKNIALIISENKGYRKPDNVRHPHSWSIIEPNDLINWLIDQQ